MDYFTALKIFHSVSELGSFTLTAKQLGLAVSSITRQMDSLEKHLDIKLFQRTTRRIYLTYAGEQYLSKTKTILADLQQANQSLKDELLSPQGKLRITFPICYGNIKIGPLLADFSRAYPKIELELLACDQRVDMFSNPIDLAIRLGKIEDERLVARLIKPQERWLCVSPEYLAKHGKITTPSDLYQHNCLPFLYPEQFPKWYFHHMNKSEDIIIRGNLSGNSIEMLTQATLDGQGISLLPDWLIQSDIDSGRLVRILTEWRVTTVSIPTHEVDGIYLVYPPNNRQITKIKLLVDYLVDRLK